MNAPTSFPPELQREIFETTALLHPSMIATLMGVARYVFIWIEPLRYRKMLFNPTPDSMKSILKLVDSKPPDFFPNAVRQLVALNISWTFMCAKRDERCSDEEIERLLRVCTRTVSLYVLGGELVPSLLMLLAKYLRPKYLIVDVCLLQESHTPADLTHSLFQNITHLHIDGSPPTTPDWPFWRQLPRIRLLSHLAVSRTTPAPVLPVILSRCLRLEALVIVCAKNSHDVDELSEGLLLHDHRVVLMGHDGSAELDWAGVDEFIRKKQRGEIEAYRHWVGSLVDI
ncbi:hypothetical protein B0H10DRAFT_474632 [Mycena sp. CBHHK59/15]|nr:hypothetical protein B0H10DRAFT_474632 [Mycena sp. CBHHK59/15]